MPKHVTAVLVILAVVFAVFQRVQVMNNNLKSWQVGNTIMLTSLEVWHIEGCSFHNFSPVQTWPNKGDKFHHAYKRLENKEGNNYYVSLPPLTWWLAHSVFETLRIAPSNYGLQVIGLTLQIIGAFFVFAFLLHYCGSNLAAFIGFLLFLFSPALVFGYNYYLFSEIVGLTFWALASYFTIKTLTDSHSKWLWLLFIANLIFVLTCWTAVLFSFCAALFLFLNKKRKSALLIVASVFTGIAIIVATYSSIDGFNALQHAWVIRFLERSGMFGNNFSDQGLSLLNPLSYKLLGTQFSHQLQWLGYASILTLVLAAFWSFRTKTTIAHAPKSRLLNPILFLFAFPAILHTLVFFNANVLHYVYQGKWALFISIVAGWTIHKLGMFDSKRPQQIGILILCLGFICSLEMNVPNDEEGDKIRTWAKEMKNDLNPNEPVFIQAGNDINTLYFSYLLKRNVVATENRSK